MRYVTSLTLLLCVLSAAAFPAQSATKEYFQQDVRYTIRARLDTGDHMLAGTERIVYTNNSPDTLRSVYLHLYPNGYRSKDTNLLREYRRRFNYTLIDLPGKYRSYLTIDSVLVDGRTVEPRIDDTLAELALPEPLLPGASLTMDVRFEEKIRRQIGRAGYRGDHYDLAQWYPKVVVYDAQGFHLDKFGMGEFFGEFGTFDVHLDVPDDYVIAATGTLAGGDPGWTRNQSGDNSPPSQPEKRAEPVAYKTVHFHADKVHDFAWSADPSFVVEDTLWNGIEVRSFYQRAHAEAWRDSTLQHGVRALAWLTDLVGPYPYPQLSIVDALMDGGMEYPMLVMDGSASEGLAMHEIGHVYFYGALANDEMEEAWLDEGATVFQTTLYLTERYGPWGKQDKWSFYHHITPQYTLAEDARNQVFELDRYRYSERVATRSSEFKNSYDKNTYVKAALIFNALRYVVGEDMFKEILREYYRRYAFQHVDEERFRSVCEAVSGYDLEWFFAQWLHTVKTCDYELASVKKFPGRSSDSCKVDVEIRRLGEIVMPLKLVFEFKDGARETFRFPGRLRTIHKTFELERKPVAVELNPENEILDIDLSNNFQPKRHDFQFDWPNNSYTPEYAYQVRYRPGFWYNDIDGFKAGLHLSGGYKQWTRMFSAGIYYGFESDRVDFSAALKKRVRFFNTNGTAILSGYKMEGRQEADLEINLRRRKYLLYPPNHQILMGINYHELRNMRFLENPETYQPGSDVGPYFGYRIDPQLDILQTSASAQLKMGRKWFGGEYKYEKFATTVTVKTRRSLVPVDARLRFFFGTIGGQMPYQQRFFLASGGPLAEERRFYLRSPGALPEDLDYHEPGHGNLRGYLLGNFGVNRLAAMNFELNVPLPVFLLGAPGKLLFDSIDLAAFSDVGKAFDDDNPIQESLRLQYLYDQDVMKKTLVDAGFGLRIRKNFPFYPLFLRIDFPLYVSQPAVNGETEEIKFRTIFSLGATF